MSEPIFRKKSMERVTSPEQLNDYIRVSNPGVWMILFAVIILLIGICVWGIFGHLDTKKETAGYCNDGKFVCYIKEADIDEIGKNALVSVNGTEYSISEISASPVQLKEETHSYLRHLAGLTADDWVYAVTVNAPELADGTYNADVIANRVSPISFVVN